MEWLACVERFYIQICDKDGREFLFNINFIHSATSVWECITEKWKGSRTQTSRIGQSEMKKEEKTGGRKPYSVLWWIWYIFLFSALWWSDVWGFTERERLSFPELASLWEMTKDLPVSMPCKYKPTNPEPLEVELSYSSPNPPTLITSRPGTKSSGSALVPQSPLTLFKIANPKLSYSALPVETTLKALACAFLCLHLPSDQYWCFPLWPCTTPSSWDLWLIYYFLHGNHLLICWFHHT